MLSKEVFQKNFVGACSAKGIPVNADAVRFLYEMVKDQFDDAEFEAITKDVFLSENFYGKMPDISLWTSRKSKSEKKGKESAYLKARQDFQDKVMEIVYTDYVPSSWKDEFRKSLTASESATMAALGGISELWSSVRQNGVYDGQKAEYLIRRIQNEFEKHYSAEADSRLMIAETKDGEMADKINNLLENLFK